MHKRCLWFIVPCIFALCVLGCAQYAQKPTIEPILPPQVLEDKPTKQPSPQEIEEYALIHQISDLKLAEFYITHPEYAKKNPYQPTAEDISFYESKFIQKMRPDMDKLIEKYGFAKARTIYMTRGSEDEDDYVSARRVVDEIIEKNKTLYQEMERASQLYREGRLDDAIRHMQNALELDQESPTILYNLGTMYLKARDYLKAVNYFEKALKVLRSTAYSNTNIEIHPNLFMGVTINLGLTYIHLGMYGEAINVLTEAVNFRHEDLDANWNLAIAYLGAGRIRESISYFDKCASLDPKNAELFNQLGLLYYDLGLYYTSLEKFRQAESIDPDNKQYSYNIGIVFSKLGRNEEAKEAFAKAVGYKDAEDMFRIYSEQDVMNRAKELYNTGCASMSSGEVDKAIQYFKEALNVKHDMFEAHVNLAICYRMKGELKNQIMHLEEASRLNPNRHDIYYNLALAYIDSGMYLNARYALERVIELMPSFKDAYFNLGFVHYKMSRYEDSANMFAKCIEISPSWFEAYINLGNAYLKLNRIPDSISAFEKAVQIKPNSAEANYDLGIAYTKAHRYDEAEAMFKKALTIDPYHIQARTMLSELQKLKT